MDSIAVFKIRKSLDTETMFITFAEQKSESLAKYYGQILS
jgi:hypothetical protein